MAQVIPKAEKLQSDPKLIAEWRGDD